MAHARDPLRPPGRAGRSGQSLVELALLLPLLALIMVGTLDLGRAFFAHQRLTNAVREGALFGIRYPAQLAASSTAGSADPYNVVYQVRQEGASADGSPDANLAVAVAPNSGSDVRCYAGRSTTLLATGAFPGDCAKAKTGDTLQVSATYAFRPLTAQLAGNIGSPLRLRATVRMVIQ